MVVLDAHRKGVFNMQVSEIEEPPENFDGQVDVEAFWNSLRLEIIARGLVQSVCCPSVMWILWIKYEGIKDGPHNETAE
ncbi:hypothetical protein cypCar_00042492 [Cyprinus carpio]|nr:hypothetical protein cypCar_00042492 [Cyprinus carpio]